MKNLKRSLIKLTETYLRNSPAPSDISPFNSTFKLSYTFSTPFTNSKSSFETYYPIFSNKNEGKQPEFS